MAEPKKKPKRPKPPRAARNAGLFRVEFKLGAPNIETKAAQERIAGR